MWVDREVQWPLTGLILAHKGLVTGTFRWVQSTELSAWDIFRLGTNSLLQITTSLPLQCPRKKGGTADNLGQRSAALTSRLFHISQSTLQKAYVSWASAFTERRLAVQNKCCSTQLQHLCNIKGSAFVLHWLSYNSVVLHDTQPNTSHDQGLRFQIVPHWTKQYTGCKWVFR